MKLPSIREAINRIKADRRAALKIYRDEQHLARRTARRIRDLKVAHELIQTIAKQLQETVHDHIAVVVTKCLQAVFDDPYEFKILFEKRANRTEARLVFVRQGVEVDPMSASGGGVVDVASFALRLACLVMSRPRLRKVIVLDEPFKFVAASVRPRMGAMLETLSREMKVQFVVITHFQELEIGRTIRV